MLLGDSGQCGGVKCFFIDKSDSGRSQGTGWLVEESRNTEKTHSILADWNRTWELGQELRATYGVRNLMLAAPRSVAIDISEARHLNQHLVWSMNGEHIPGRFHPGVAVVEPVRSCLWPMCLIFGCDKETEFERRVGAFVCQVKNTSKLLYELEQSIDSSRAMLEAKSCLRLDFQAFIRNDGTIFHIDLDRCFEPMIDDEGRTLTAPQMSVMDRCLDNVIKTVHATVSDAESGHCH